MNQDKYKWNLTDLYNSDDDPNILKDFNALMKESYSFINKWKDRKDYLKDPKILREALDEYAHFMEKYGIGGASDYYLSLRNRQEQSNKHIIQKLKDLEKQELDLINDLQFFEYRISKIPPKQQNAFLSSKDLQPYKQYLKKLFETSKYLLSEEEEKILTLTYLPSHANWVKMLKQFLSKESIEIVDKNGEKKKVPFTANNKYLKSKK